MKASVSSEEKELDRGGRLYLHPRKLLSTSVADERPLSRMDANMSSKVFFSYKDPPAEVTGQGCFSGLGTSGAFLPTRARIVFHNVVGLVGVGCAMQREEKGLGIG